MLGGTRELLEVRNTALVGDSGLKSLVWVDSNGEGYKTFIASANLRSFRTTPVTAQAVASLFELQALEVRSIPLQGAIQTQLDGAVSESTTYRVTHESKDPFSLFSDRTNQRIRSVDAKSAEVSVFSVNESQELVGGIAAEERVDPNTLASTELIPASSTFVAKLASAILASAQELDPEKATVSEKVRTCQKELFKRIQFKEFDNQVHSINQVIRLKKANAVEHAILMTAVCRSLKIPARIAFGYQYNGSSDAPAMRFHAWVEYRDSDKWIPIDSTEKDPGLKLDRIKVIESSYSDSNPYDPFLNVVRMMAELEIKVLPK
jgi:transglutaminase-like putative cysteine protease